LTLLTEPGLYSS